MMASTRTVPRFSRMKRFGAATGLLLAAAGLPATAQDAPAAGTVTFKISDVATAGQLVRVPVNKSVMIDFSVPVKEARLAKAEIAEVTATSPRQVLITGKSFGTTQLIVWLGENEQKVFDLAVDIEMERLAASIRTAVPRAKVQAHALMDAVVLTGSVPDADSAKRVMEVANAFAPKVMNQLKVAGVQQVLLRCTVAEVNRRATRQLGFNGWIAGDDFRDVFIASNLDGINPTNIGAVAGAAASGLTPIPFAVGSDGIPVTGRTTMTFGFPRVQMQIFVQALRENGLLRVLAEPNLVTVNGQEANFLAGGEFPVPVPSDSGIGIEYREFGVKLRFTPAVISENLVRLKVAPEVSEPDFTTAITILGTTVPGLAQRKVETVVELGSGQTFAIGGLLSDRVRSTSRKVPGLGDVPVLGSLFSSVDYQSDESELVILVTPELVEPVSGEQITYIPGSSYRQPNDFELFMLGKLEGANGERRLQPRVNQSWPVRPDELFGEGATPKLRGPVGPAGSEEGS